MAEEQVFDLVTPDRLERIQPEIDWNLFSLPKKYQQPTHRGKGKFRTNFFYFSHCESFFPLFGQIR